MTGPILGTQAGTTLNGIAADSHSLDQLRQVANQDPAKAVHQVATQFEALFMQMVLKSMRDASPKSGMLESSDQETYTGMLDQQLAQKIASGGTGLAAVIERQLSRNLPQAKTDAAAAASAVVPGPAGGAAAPTSGIPMVQTLQAAAALRSGK